MTDSLPISKDLEFGLTMDTAGTHIVIKNISGTTITLNEVIFYVDAALTSPTSADNGSKDDLWNAPWGELAPWNCSPSGFMPIAENNGFTPSGLRPYTLSYTKGYTLSPLAQGTFSYSPTIAVNEINAQTLAKIKSFVLKQGGNTYTVPSAKLDALQNTSALWNVAYKNPRAWQVQVQSAVGTEFYGQEIYAPTPAATIITQNALTTVGYAPSSFNLIHGMQCLPKVSATYTDAAETSYTCSLNMSGLEMTPIAGGSTKSIAPKTNQPPLSGTDRRVVGYFPNYGMYGRHYDVPDIPLQYLTQVSYSFVYFDYQGNLVSSDSWADSFQVPALQYLKRLNPGLKVFLVFGGWPKDLNLVIQEVASQSDIPEKNLAEDAGQVFLYYISGSSEWYYDGCTFTDVGDPDQPLSGPVSQLPRLQNLQAYLSALGTPSLPLDATQTYLCEKPIADALGFTRFFPAANLFKIISSSTATDNFATNAANALADFDFDGVAIDWEYPTADDAADYVKFLTTLSQKLKEKNPNFEVSIAAPANQSIIGRFTTAQWTDIGTAVDQINIMAYDYFGGFSQYSYFNAPMSSNPKFKDTGTIDQVNIEDTVSAYLELANQSAFPTDRLSLGVPAYARAMYVIGANSTNQGIGLPVVGVPSGQWGSGGVFDYSYIASLAEGDGGSTAITTDYALPTSMNYVMVPNQYAETPFAYCIKDVNGNDWFMSFDNQASAVYKTQWSINQGLGGMMIWDLSMDSPNAATSLAASISKTLLEKPVTAKTFVAQEWNLWFLALQQTQLKQIPPINFYQAQQYGDVPDQTMFYAGSAVQALASLSNGKLIAVSQDATRIWNRVDAKWVNPTTLNTRTGDSVTAVEVMPDSDIVLGYHSGAIQVWSKGATGYQVSRSVAPTQNPVYSLATLPDGNLAVGSDPDITLYSLPYASSGASALTLESTLTGSAGSILDLLPLPDGRLVSASSGAQVKIWSLSTSGNITATTTGATHTATVNSLALLSDGQFLSGSSDKTILVWTASGTEHEQFNATQVGQTASNEILVLQMLPSGGFMSADSQGNLLIQGVCEADIHGNSSSLNNVFGLTNTLQLKGEPQVTAATVLPSGEIVVSANDRSVHTMSFATWPQSQLVTPWIYYNSDGDTLLHKVAGNGNLQGVNTILANQGDPNIPNLKTLRPPLYNALQAIDGLETEYPRVVTRLIEAGASIFVDQGGSSSLMDLVNQKALYLLSLPLVNVMPQNTSVASNPVPASQITLDTSLESLLKSQPRLALSMGIAMSHISPDLAQKVLSTVESDLKGLAAKASSTKEAQTLPVPSSDQIQQAQQGMLSLLEQSTGLSTIPVAQSRLASEKFSQTVHWTIAPSYNPGLGAEYAEKTKASSDLGAQLATLKSQFQSIRTPIVNKAIKEITGVEDGVNNPDKVKVYFSGKMEPLQDRIEMRKQFNETQSANLETQEETRTAWRLAFANPDPQSQRHFLAGQHVQVPGNAAESDIHQIFRNRIQDQGEQINGVQEAIENNRNKLTEDEASLDEYQVQQTKLDQYSGSSYEKLDTGLAVAGSFAGAAVQGAQMCEYMINTLFPSNSELLDDAKEAVYWATNVSVVVGAISTFSDAMKTFNIARDAEGLLSADSIMSLADGIGAIFSLGSFIFSLFGGGMPNPVLKGLKDISKQIHSMNEQMVKGFNGVFQDLDGLSKEVSHGFQQMEKGLNTVLSTMQYDIKGLSKQVGEVSKQVAAVSTQVSKLSEQETRQFHELQAQIRQDNELTIHAVQVGLNETVENLSLMENGLQSDLSYIQALLQASITNAYNEINVAMLNAKQEQYQSWLTGNPEQLREYRDKLENFIENSLLPLGNQPFATLVTQQVEPTLFQNQFEVDAIGPQLQSFINSHFSECYAYFLNSQAPYSTSYDDLAQSMYFSAPYSLQFCGHYLWLQNQYWPNLPRSSASYLSGRITKLVQTPSQQAMLSFIQQAPSETFFQQLIDNYQSSVNALFAGASQVNPTMEESALFFSAALTSERMVQIMSTPEPTLSLEDLESTSIIQDNMPETMGHYVKVIDEYFANKDASYHYKSIFYTAVLGHGLGTCKIILSQRSSSTQGIDVITLQFTNNDNINIPLVSLKASNGNVTSINIAYNEDNDNGLRLIREANARAQGEWISQWGQAVLQECRQDIVQLDCSVFTLAMYLYLAGFSKTDQSTLLAKLWNSFKVNVYLDTLGTPNQGTAGGTSSSQGATTTSTATQGTATGSVSQRGVQGSATQNTSQASTQGFGNTAGTAGASTSQPSSTGLTLMPFTSLQTLSNTLVGDAANSVQTMITNLSGNESEFYTTLKSNFTNLLVKSQQSLFWIDGVPLFDAWSQAMPQSPTGVTITTVDGNVQIALQPLYSSAQVKVTFNTPLACTAQSQLLIGGSGACTLIAEGVASTDNLDSANQTSTTQNYPVAFTDAQTDCVVDLSKTGFYSIQSLAVEVSTPASDGTFSDAATQGGTQGSTATATDQVTIDSLVLSAPNLNSNWLWEEATQSVKSLLNPGASPSSTLSATGSSQGIKASSSDNLTSTNLRRGVVGA